MKWLPVFLILTGVLITGCSNDNLALMGESAPQLKAEASSSLRILVIGGTSGIGLETVKLALDRGHQVSAMARRPERMTLIHDRLETVKGDVLDAEAVGTLLAGHDAVVFAIGIGPTQKPVIVFSQGTQNVLEAMQKSNVQQLIAVTGIGAGDSRGHGTFMYNNFTQRFLVKTMYEDKDRAEALIHASDVNWTIVRPGFLNNDASEKQYRVITNLQDIISGDITRADVAHFIMAAIEGKECQGKTVLLTN
jgi:putative NADH-flavin reductase